MSSKTQCQPCAVELRAPARRQGQLDLGHERHDVRRWSCESCARRTGRGARAIEASLDVGLSGDIEAVFPEMGFGVARECRGRLREAGLRGRDGKRSQRQVEHVQSVETVSCLRSTRQVAGRTRPTEPEEGQTPGEVEPDVAGMIAE